MVDNNDKQLHIFSEDGVKKSVEVVDRLHLYVWSDGKITKTVGCKDLPADQFAHIPFGECFDEHVPMYHWEVGGVWCGVDSEGHIYDDIGRMIGKKTEPEVFELKDDKKHSLCCYITCWIDDRHGELEVWSDDGDCIGSIIEGVRVKQSIEDDDFTMLAVYEDGKIYDGRKWIGQASKWWMEQCFSDKIIFGLRKYNPDIKVCEKVKPIARFKCKPYSYNEVNVSVMSVRCEKCDAYLNATFDPYYRDMSSFFSLDGNNAHYCFQCGGEIDWKNPIWIDETEKED